MTSLDRMKSVRFGLHSSVSDFSSTPGTLPFLEPKVAGLMPFDTERLDENVFRGDGMDSPAIVGVKTLPDIQLDLDMRGVASNTGGALAAATATEVGPLLNSIMGVSSVDPSGASTTITADNGSTSSLTLASTTNFADGVGVLFETTSGRVVREQVSKLGSVLTLDRAWVDGAPASDAVPYRSVYWTLEQAVNAHVHAMMRGEGQDWRRDFVGCAGSLVISGAEGKPVSFSSKWKPTDWADADEANPSFVAPTAGNYIMNINGGLWIGAEKFMFKSWSLDLGFEVQPAGSITGPNGVQGYKVTKKAPVLTGMLYFGTGGASVGEISDSAGNVRFDQIQGLINKGLTTAKAKGSRADTYDIALQVDDRPGACLYVRMPAAELSGTMTIDNGLEMISLIAKPRRPASGSALRLHVF